MRAPLFAAVLLGACGHPPNLQPLASLASPVPLEVLIPPQGGIGAASFEAWVQGIEPGRRELMPAPGVVLTCQAKASGQLTIRAVVTSAEADAKTGEVKSSCPLAPQSIPVIIRW